MKNQKILRTLLLDRVNRALLVNPQKMYLECQKLGVSKNTIYDFTNYDRSYVKNDLANKLYWCSKAVLG